jgi:hypothetical protein
LPFLPQLAAPASVHIARGSALPAAIFVHFPGADGSAQLRQAPVQAPSQQTPSTQYPDLHSVPTLQLWPFCLGPQVWLTHAIPVSQSVSALQTTPHMALPQRNGEQFVSVGTRHVPRPSHVAALVSLFVPEQTCAAHCVSTA